ncbi:MAG TPA: hypothetical protein VKV30_04320 [Candidatus Angelobacter sp.]|nr:hypothetical protein [Candidatus Angelobacter sp.]
MREWSLKISKSAVSQTKSDLCDPLPTGQLERENKAEIDRDWSPEKREKEGSTSFRQAFRIEVELLFSTKAHGGGVSGLKDAGRGTQKRLPKSPELPKLAI